MNPRSSFRFIPLGYAVVLLSLLLPFCNLKCGGETIATVQGTDMIFKGKIEIAGKLRSLMDMDDDRKSENKTDNEDDDRAKFSVWVLIAAALGLSGTALFFAIGKKGYAGHLGIAAAGLLSLILFAVTKDKLFDLDDLKKPGGDSLDGMGGDMISIRVGLAIGYWLCLAGFVAAGVLAYLNNRSEKTNRLTDIDSQNHPAEPL
jgi:hypothetical protein